MARADATIARISGYAQGGFTDSGDVGATAGVGYDVPDALGKGTVGRRTVIVAGVTFGLLFLYWRGAKGY